MKTNYCVLFWLVSVAFFGCASNSSRNTAEDFDSGPASDVIRTARLVIGFDYRKQWKKAKHHDAAALHSLFHFTDSEGFVGAGADEHCSILQDLLRLWGDRAYARELGMESPKIREAVISALDYHGDPKWKARKYPATYALGKHEALLRWQSMR